MLCQYQHGENRSSGTASTNYTKVKMDKLEDELNKANKTANNLTDNLNCWICDENIKIEEKAFECGECDKFVCARCAKESHISDEFFTCSPCLQ